MSPTRVRQSGAWVVLTSTVQSYLSSLSPLSVAFFGDSFTYGDHGPSSLAMRYATRTAALLSATESDFSVGGARYYFFNGNIATQVYQHISPPSVAPYKPVYRAAVSSSTLTEFRT